MENTERRREVAAPPPPGRAVNERTSTGREACVEVSELHYRYREGTDALQGLSFRAEAGTITALLGPNGSGKSTTFKILTTQMAPQAGDAKIFGHSVAAERAQVRSLLGVAFQSPSLDPWLTVQENLEIHAALYGLSSRESGSRIRDLLGLLRVQDRANDRVKTLSGGLARRVELAKTLLSAPKLLVLDEPTTGLDPRARLEFWAELRRLRDSGLSILVSTHLMEEAELCDAIFIVNKGRIAAGGKPEELKSQLGGEWIHVEGDDLREEESRLRTAFGAFGKVSFAKDGSLRVETTDVDKVFGLLRKALGARARRISVERPSLADVYLHFTGDVLS